MLSRQNAEQLELVFWADVAIGEIHTKCFSSEGNKQQITDQQEYPQTTYTEVSKPLNNRYCH